MHLGVFLMCLKIFPTHFMCSAFVLSVYCYSVSVCNMCIICVVFSFILVISRYLLWPETGGQDRKV